MNVANLRDRYVYISLDEIDSVGDQGKNWRAELYMKDQAENNAIYKSFCEEFLPHFDTVVPRFSEAYTHHRLYAFYSSLMSGEHMYAGDITTDIWLMRRMVRTKAMAKELLQICGQLYGRLYQTHEPYETGSHFYWPLLDEMVELAKTVGEKHCIGEALVNQLIDYTRRDDYYFSELWDEIKKEQILFESVLPMLETVLRQANLEYRCRYVSWETKSSRAISELEMFLCLPMNRSENSLVACDFVYQRLYTLMEASSMELIRAMEMLRRYCYPSVFTEYILYAVRTLYAMPVESTTEQEILVIWCQGSRCVFGVRGFVSLLCGSVGDFDTIYIQAAAMFLGTLYWERGRVEQEMDDCFKTLVFAASDGVHSPDCDMQEAIRRYEKNPQLDCENSPENYLAATIQKTKEILNEDFSIYD